MGGTTFPPPRPLFPQPQPPFPPPPQPSFIRPRPLFPNKPGPLFHDPLNPNHKVEDYNNAFIVSHPNLRGCGRQVNEDGEVVKVVYVPHEGWLKPEVVVTTPEEGGESFVVTLRADGSEEGRASFESVIEDIRNAIIWCHEDAMKDIDRWEAEEIKKVDRRLKEILKRHKREEKERKKKEREERIKRKKEAKEQEKREALMREIEAKEKEENLKKMDSKEPEAEEDKGSKAGEKEQEQGTATAESDEASVVTSTRRMQRSQRSTKMWPNVRGGKVVSWGSAGPLV
ncbi:hypothetical protein PRZ48_011787 [Zasmidium cellare]|uniref:Uncharacterized protein n=1 Tax=Zasmidium cellare TaxID=395010 RepID=A0ABR0E7Z6_ZASCE|nr:hypothetical protein PRZ48_011787 [Zasmidium cellare]